MCGATVRHLALCGATVRHIALCGAMAAVSSPSYADEAATPADDAASAGDAAPADAAAKDIGAELERHDRAIRELQAKQEDQASKLAAVRVSGFAQVDWVAHHQASRDEIDDTTGRPLNQDRFTLR